MSLRGQHLHPHSLLPLAISFHISVGMCRRPTPGLGSFLLVSSSGNSLSYHNYHNLCI